MQILIEELIKEKNEEKEIKIMLNMRHLIILAEQFNINAEEEKKLFFKYFEEEEF
jgi:hypothetical protein